ncbi:MAG: hypothetical protein ABI321_00110 [Polyangia bacterium]
MIACPACHEPSDPVSEICMECGEPLEPGTQDPEGHPAVAASAPPPVPVVATRAPVVPKRKLRVDEPDPVRCPGCGSPGRGVRCGGCGTLLRRSDD